jgi:hypothetical protein
LENIHASWDVALWLFRVIGTHWRISLFEVNVYSNWLDEVQGIILIEGQSEASF